MVLKTEGRQHEWSAGARRNLNLRRLSVRRSVAPQLGIPTNVWSIALMPYASP